MADTSTYSFLDGAKSADELRARLLEVRQRANRAAASIASRKGWR